MTLMWSFAIALKFCEEPARKVDLIDFPGQTIVQSFSINELRKISVRLLSGFLMNSGDA